MAGALYVQAPLKDNVGDGSGGRNAMSHSVQRQRKIVFIFAKR